MHTISLNTWENSQYYSIKISFIFFKFRIVKFGLLCFSIANSKLNYKIKKYFLNSFNKWPFYFKCVSLGQYCYIDSIKDMLVRSWICKGAWLFYLNLSEVIQKSTLLHGLFFSLKIIKVYQTLGIYLLCCEMVAISGLF